MTSRTAQEDSMTIPEDVLAAAIRALMVPERDMAESVSRAILAAEQRGEAREREREITDRMVQAGIAAANLEMANIDPLEIKDGQLEFPPDIAAKIIRAAITAAIRKGTAE